MKTFISAVAISMAALTTAYAAPLNGQDLRKAIAGKTLIISARGHTIPVRFSANGSMSGSFKGIFAGQRSDRGRWWISGNQLCQQWSNWLDGKSHCAQVSGKGSNLSWRGGGYSGTARIAG